MLYKKRVSSTRRSAPVSNTKLRNRKNSYDEVKLRYGLAGVGDTKLQLQDVLSGNRERRTIREEKRRHLFRKRDTRYMPKIYRHLAWGALLRNAETAVAMLGGTPYKHRHTYTRYTLESLSFFLSIGEIRA